MRSNSRISTKTCNSRRNFAYRKLAPMRRNTLDESTLPFSFTFPYVMSPFFLPSFLFNQNNNKTSRWTPASTKEIGKIAKVLENRKFFPLLLVDLIKEDKNVTEKSELRDNCVHAHDERSILSSLIRLLKMSKKYYLRYKIRIILM